MIKLRISILNFYQKIHHNIGVFNSYTPTPIAKPSQNQHPTIATTSIAKPYTNS